METIVTNLLYDFQKGYETETRTQSLTMLYKMDTTTVMSPGFPPSTEALVCHCLSYFKEDMISEELMRQ